MKLVPYFALPQFSPRTLATSAMLLSFAFATNFLGLWLARRTPTELFYRITYLLMFLISLALIWQGVGGILRQGGCVMSRDQRRSPAASTP